MKKLFEINHWIKTHGDWDMDLIRIYLGVVLFAKALYFMSHSDYLLGLLEATGYTWIASAALGHYVIFAHLIGGVFLIIGLLTRAAALVQLPVLFAAVFFVHLPEIMTSIQQRQNLEFSALVLFLLVLLAIYGSGRLSVDYLIGRKVNAELFRTGEPQGQPQPTQTG
jgi:putative oxidoreductase